MCVCVCVCVCVSVCMCVSASVYKFLSVLVCLFVFIIIKIASLHTIDDMCPELLFSPTLRPSNPSKRRAFFVVYEVSTMSDVLS